jgi:hypothetical protein
LALCAKDGAVRKAAIEALRYIVRSIRKQGPATAAPRHTHVSRKCERQQTTNWLGAGLRHNLNYTAV